MCLLDLWFYLIKIILIKRKVRQLFNSKKGQLLGLLVTLFFLALVLTRIQFDKVGNAFSQANYFYLIPAITVTMLGYFARAYRWQIILKPTKLVPFKQSYSIMMIGFMANNLLPARIGEFVRAYTLGAQEEISKSLSLATIVLERVCDGLTLIALMGFSLMIFPSPHQTGDVAFIEFFSTTVFIGAIIFLVFLLVREKLALKIISLVMRPLPNRIEKKVQGLLMSFVLGLHALKRRTTLVGIVGLSLLVWSLEGSSYYLMLWAFNLQDKMSPLQLIGAGIFLLVFVNLGTMVPSAPGFIGVYQVAAVIALGAYSVDENIAFSLAILTNTFQYVLVTAIGLFFFSRMNLSFKSLKASSQETNEEQRTIEMAAADS